MKKILMGFMALVFFLPIGLKAQVNSPAYQSYQELLKSGDSSFTSSIYACFEDDQQSKAFSVISASVGVQDMTAMFQMFVDGISKWDDVFSGKLDPYSGPAGLFATLPTMNAPNPLNLSHQTDTFEWGPDTLRVKLGFGTLLSGQLRSSWEFDMRRSTGRYTETVVFDKGFEPDGFTIKEAGKCIRIPNIGMTPEEQRNQYSRHK